MSLRFGEARDTARRRLRGAGFPEEDVRYLIGELWRLAGGSGAALVGVGEALSPSASQRFQELLERAVAGEPLAYLEGVCGFYGLEFRVDPRVLVPRPDSECLVDAALELLPRDGRGRLADLGTGSGCLLLSVLARRPGWRGVGIDRSAAALAVASRNARDLGLSGRVRFVHADWLTACAPRSFELILANPPYVVPGEPLGPGVAEREPALALFTPPEDPLAAYRAILARAASVLSPHGVLILELGAGRAREVEDLAHRHAFHAQELRRDLGGVERALVLRPEAIEPPSG